MTDKESKWIKFYPSLELPKERVSIAYATHDERGYRFAYGYFQFYNGTCGCFWKDGNEQPKVVKAEDIKYWMPVPSLDVQEEPVSEDLEEAAEEWDESLYRSDAFKAGAKWKEQQFEKNRLKHCDELTEEQAQMESDFVTQHLKENNRTPTFIDAIEYGMRLQEEQMIKDALECVVKVDAGGYPYIDRCIELYDYDKDIPLAKEGDKVKVIVIKEE